MRTYTIQCHNFAEAGARFLLQQMKHLSVVDNVREVFEMASDTAFDADRAAKAADRLCGELERHRAIEMDPLNVLLLVEATEGSSRLYTCLPSEREELVNDARSIARDLRRYAQRPVYPDFGPDRRG